MNGLLEYSTTDTLELLHKKASKYRSGEEQFAFLMSAYTIMKDENVVPPWAAGACLAIADYLWHCRKDARTTLAVVTDGVEWCDPEEEDLWRNLIHYKERMQKELDHSGQFGVHPSIHDLVSGYDEFLSIYGEDCAFHDAVIEDLNVEIRDEHRTVTLKLYLWHHWFTMVFHDAVMVNTILEDNSFFYEMESWREKWYSGPKAVLEFTGDAYLKISCSHIDFKDFIEDTED